MTTTSCEGALLARPSEGLGKRPQLPIAADQRRIEVTGEATGSFPVDGDQPVSHERLGLALRLYGLDRLGADCVADEPVGPLSQQHLARGRRLLEPRGDVDCITRGESLSSGGIAGDHRAGVDSDSDPQATAGPRTQLLAQLLQAIAELGGGSDRSQGIVLSSGRDPKGRHHRIADVLLDRAAVAFDRLASQFEVAIHRLADELGIEGLAHLRRPADVGEDQGHGLAAGEVGLRGLGSRPVF